MEDNIWQEILMKSPLGFALHKVVLGSDGEPVDYIFLSANPAFEAMTGLTKEDIIGKKVTEVLPDIRSGEFDWVALYGQIALTGEQRQFTQYSEPLKRWYKVSAFSMEKGTFITLFQDISQEMDILQALREQEKQIRELGRELETVFNGSHDAIFIVKVEGEEFRYTRNNAAYRKLTGLSLEDTKGKTPVEALGRKTGEKVTDSLRRCLEARKPISFEETLEFPAGKRVWLTTITPVFENGEISYLVGSRKDISQQKQAEEEKESLNKRLYAMFNEHSAIMMLLEPDTGKIVDVNPAACKFYGYSKEEFLQLSIQDINTLDPQEVKELRQEALRKNRKYFLFNHRLKNGTIKSVDVYSCPVNVQGKPLLFSIIFDATERQEYKSQLFLEKELLRVTLESIGDGVVTTDHCGKITFINAAAQAIIGWKQEETYGVPFEQVFRLYNEENGVLLEDPVAEVIRKGTIVGLANHTVLETKDGKRVPIADSAAPIRNEAGEMLGVVMVFRDVSVERKHQKQIMYLSYYDSLTGLRNRRFMEEEIERLDASGLFPISVIMGDLNGLKLTNDVFGHAAGDLLLKKAGLLIKASCRKGDIVARWGGDEFVVFLPRTSLEEAEKILRRIKSRCELESDGPFQLSISLGVAQKTDANTSLYQVINEAEEAMYHNKFLEGKSHRHSLINTMVATLYAKSMETQEHADRLKDFCIAIGKELNLSIKEFDQLEILAMLHDIGKVGISETILQKPGPLTKEEWEQMKKHPQIGFRIAQNTPELVQVAESILSHHERWDGKGYPQGLEGDKIPLLSRILAVADAFDAMISDRTYRKAMSQEDAKNEIIKNSGTQFDPQIVEAFIKVLERDSGNIA